MFSTSLRGLKETTEFPLVVILFYIVIDVSKRFISRYIYAQNVYYILRIYASSLLFVILLQTHWSHVQAPDKSNISITILLWVFVVEPNKIIGYYEHKDVLCQLSFNLWFCERALVFFGHIHYGSTQRAIASQNARTKSIFNKSGVTSFTC